jgi:hypothetical protein
MRYNKMAAVAVAILCLGIMSVAAFTPRPGSPEAAPRAVSTPEPALATFYVPAQHVNAAAAVEKPVEEYY